jgi:hypothetical protein
MLLINEKLLINQHKSLLNPKKVIILRFFSEVIENALESVSFIYTETSIMMLLGS